jgi:glycosyltransferase involved in cell wall biosynthesis
MPVLEAMAAGVPVVAGNRSALPEVCGDAAELVDPVSEDEMAQAMITLANNPQRRQEMVKLGFRHAATFRWENAVSDTLAVYRELL